MLNIDLFENIENNDVLELLKCMGLKTKIFKKNSYILKKGSKINFLGILLEGYAEIIKTDKLNRDITAEKLRINDIFGHDIVCLGLTKSPVDIYTKTGCEILFIPFEKAVTPCEKLCRYHFQLIKNIMKMISKKNSVLNNKLDIIAQKTTREKILSFLQDCSKGDKSFYIPYTREEMAKFLCSDRSALSRELCKMRDEGLLRFSKNYFELLY